MWFGPEDRPLFGWFCVPDDGRARAVVVVCNPIGSECDNAQVAFDALGRRLVDRRVALLRFDYDGTGDSAGSWADEGRLEAWLGSVRAAVAFARSAGAPQVAVVGMRMGALLALAALEGQGVDALVLWDPCASGRQFLREQALLLATAYGESQPGGGAAEGPATYYRPATASALSAFDPAVDGPPAPCVLVLGREGRALGGAVARLVERGQAERGVVRGQAELLDVPGISRVEDEDLDEVTGWLAAHLGEADAALDPGGRARALLPAGDGVRVVEEAVDLGDVPLFGIRCGPVDDGRPPVAVFLTAGLLHRSGPARMWTDLARRWAALGVPSVRVDLSGTGFSGTRPGQARQVVLAPEAVDDVAKIAAALGSPDCRGLVLVGLSASGYLAVEAALQFHPLGICPVNPSLTSQPAEEEHGTGPAVLRLAHRPSLLPRLRERHKRVADRLAWAAAQVLVQRSPAGPLVQAARRGSRVLVVATHTEAAPLRGNLFWEAAGRRARKRGAYRLLVLPGRDHSLYLQATREPAMAAMTDWVVELHRAAGAGS